MRRICNDVYVRRRWNAVPKATVLMWVRYLFDVCRPFHSFVRIVYLYYLVSEVPITRLLNLLKTKRRLLYLKTQSVPRCKHFPTQL
jgi:hypothetical protein